MIASVNTNLHKARKKMSTYMVVLKSLNPNQKVQAIKFFREWATWPVSDCMKAIDKQIKGLTPCLRLFRNASPALAFHFKAGFEARGIGMIEIRDPYNRAVVVHQLQRNYSVPDAITGFTNIYPRLPDDIELASREAKSVHNGVQWVQAINEAIEVIRHTRFAPEPPRQPKQPTPRWAQTSGKGGTNAKPTLPAGVPPPKPEGTSETSKAMGPQATTAQDVRPPEASTVAPEAPAAAREHKPATGHVHHKHHTHAKAEPPPRVTVEPKETKSAVPVPTASSFMDAVRKMDAHDIAGLLNEWSRHQTDEDATAVTNFAHQLMMNKRNRNNGNSRNRARH